MTINDLIATSSTHAYNNGVGEGRRQERERILRICDEISVYYESSFTGNMGDVVFIKDLISYMNDKDYE